MGGGYDDMGGGYYSGGRGSMYNDSNYVFVDPHVLGTVNILRLFCSYFAYVSFLMSLSFLVIFFYLSILLQK